MTTGQSLLGALVLTVILALLHLLASRIRKLPLVPERYTGSFAGGTAVTYVFLHLLPDIAGGNEAIGEALEDSVTVTPLLDLGIFMVAPAGFTVFYGLQRMAASQDLQHHARNPPSSGAHWLHLGSFAVYNVLITYTMALRLQTGILFALLFTVAM